MSLLAFLVAPVPALADTSPIDAEREFIAPINIELAKHGLGAVTERNDVTTVARGLVRALDVPPTSHRRFTDVAGTVG